MAQQAIHFEWSISEEATVWQEADQRVSLARPDFRLIPPGAYPRSAPLLHTIVLLVISLLSVASSGSLVQVDQQTRLQMEIAATLQREEGFWRQNEPTRFRELLDADVRREWRSDWFLPWGIEPDRRATLGVEVMGVEMQDDRLLVYTQVNEPMIAWWRSIPYRELRFYRQSREGWVRTSPEPASFGPLRTLATPHLRLQFYESDAPVILAIAVRMELAYVQLHRLLGQTPTATPLTLNFVVAPDQMREFRVSEEPLRFSSPRLLKTPLGQTNEEYTAHLVISHLADRTLLQLLGEEGRQRANRWRTMFWGASGRLRSQVLGERSPWQHEAEQFFRQADRSQRPLRFTDIDDRYPSLTAPREAYLWEYMAAESLIAYIVQTYGWEGVTSLFREFGHSNYWSKLAPNAFAQPMSELEAGWNRYLNEHYSTVPTAQQESSLPRP
jgi:hypothetical protein